MSGTLSYIFNSYRGGMRFSHVVADAKRKGYTEPDPREDLSGKASMHPLLLDYSCALPHSTHARFPGFPVPELLNSRAGLDVARKVVILARACGLPIEMSSLSIESLVPGPLAALASGDEYMQQLPKVCLIHVLTEYLFSTFIP